ncbi:hypothetical protein cyc_06654 [Cyclospora cayetanensis]|uniref:Uncharacterized protein n=1 Tax=Cyclospora cayetanensis TaxID=88456 RepID=A0A1D3D0M4_9EIME|nr:hypothetical protein cyc_06654 [Cyclospora cayetanensis]
MSERSHTPSLGMSCVTHEGRRRSTAQAASEEESRQRMTGSPPAEMANKQESQREEKNKNKKLHSTNQPEEMQLCASLLPVTARFPKSPWHGRKQNLSESVGARRVSFLEFPQEQLSPAPDLEGLASSVEEGDG